jgi:hypothetical protein
MILCKDGVDPMYLNAGNGSCIAVLAHVIMMLQCGADVVQSALVVGGRVMHSAGRLNADGCLQDKVVASPNSAVHRRNGRKGKGKGYSIVIQFLALKYISYSLPRVADVRTDVKVTGRT